jgi:hypothetical protein
MNPSNFTAKSRAHSEQKISAPLARHGFKDDQYSQYGPPKIAGAGSQKPKNS